MSRADPFRPNQLIPGTNYRYIRVLGEGGQGIVVLAADDFLQTEVVIKFVHASHALFLSPRIRDEARTLAKLKHPSIVRVIGGGMTAEEQPRGYFVMERLEGDTLYALMRRRGAGFPIRTSIDVVIDLLEALDVAHSPPHSMIHRDIKPGNVFMARMSSQETRPVLLDFGLVHLFDEASKATGKRFIGTLEYAAPEQLLGQPLSPRTDLYALGCVLYELIAGRHPFPDALRDREAMVRAHLERTPPRLSSLGLDMDLALDQLVHSALEKDPRKRPKTALDFLTKLKAVRTTLDMLHPEPMSHDKTEEEPLETLWARMGITPASAVTGPLVSAPSSSKPRRETIQDAPRVLPAVSPARKELGRARTSPAPTEELPQTAHHRAAMKRFRAAITDTTPPLKDVSHAPVVQSTAQRLVDRHGSVLFPMLGVVLAIPVVFAVYEHQQHSAASSSAVGTSSPAPVVPIAPPLASVRAIASATLDASVGAPPPRIARPSVPMATSAQAPATARAAPRSPPQRMPGAGLDAPHATPSTEPEGLDLLTVP